MESRRFRTGKKSIVAVVGQILDAMIQTGLTGLRIFIFLAINPPPLP